MTDEDHSCLLRRLTLCDGQEVITRDGRAYEWCHCARVAECDERGLAALGSQARHERARTVARSAELKRTTEQRQRWISGSPF